MKPEQYPKDEILDEDDRIARSWLTAEVKDSEGEFLPVDDMKRTMNTYMKRGGFITDTHTNRVVGKTLNWKIEEHPDAKKPAILVDYQIFRDYVIDDQVWAGIKSGKRKGLSYGGQSLKEPVTKIVDGKPVKMRGELQTFEIASVDNPANPLALNTHVNFMAKGHSNSDELKLIQDLRKGFAGDIMKPFADFQGFDECLEAQQGKGHSEESAKRICGWLKHRFEKGAIKEKISKGDDAVLIDVGELNEEQTEKLVEYIQDLLSDEGKALKGRANKKKSEEINMPEDEKPKELMDDSEQPKKPTVEEEIAEMKSMLKELISAKKQEEESEEEKPKPEEEETKEEEDSDSEPEATDAPETSEEAEATKEGDGEETKLPKSPNDPMVETDSPAPDKEHLTEKKIQKMLKTVVQDELKKAGLKKVSTKRPLEKPEAKKEESRDFSMEMLNKAKEGLLTPADMNRMTREQIKKQKGEKLQKALAMVNGGDE